MSLSPTGSNVTGSFQVIGTGSEPVAIEVRIFERQTDIYGIENRVDAEENFMIYPPQILLNPGEVQTIRVTWLGDPELESEQAFRLITEQLPIRLDDAAIAPSNGLQVNITAIYNYVASVYVTPPGAEPLLSLNAAHELQDGKDMLMLTFNNQGTAHQLLENLQLTLMTEATTLQLASEDLEGVSGENILAQHQRQFMIPWPESLPIGEITANFNLGY
ncbi:MAG: fimbria/pilus periplasmic chaperone [Leptolyngbyaceae bacterium]|nr:fimbria/pilus periplasmic chaperone [Leptolyngbyaceae bacterium]